MLKDFILKNKEKFIKKKISFRYTLENNRN